MLELTLHNRASEIPLAHQALDQFTAQHGLDGRKFGLVHVALEEHLTNIISYGYDPGQSGTIRIRFERVDSEVRIEIEDDARPFNPNEAGEVDTSVPLDKKPIGGLGVHLIRKSADELNYQRTNGRNRLTFVKRVRDASSGNP